MLRVPGGRRVFAGLLFSSMMMALAILPGSGLSGSAAAIAPESCPEYEEYPGTPGFPTCYLDIEGTPATIAEGALFSFEVRVEDAEGVLVTGDCASDDLITVTDGQEGDTLDVVLAVDGIATFTNVSLSDPGEHELVAFVNGYDETCGTALYGTSEFILVTEAGPAGTQCPPTEACTSDPITSPSGETAASITAGPGALITASFSTLADANYTACAGTEPRDAGGVLTFDATGTNLPKLVKLEVVNGRPIKVCWNAPERFKKAGGGWSAADPIPGAGFTGLLPNCLSIRPTLPCVLPAIAKRNAPTITVYVLAPAGDPKAFISRG